MITLAYKTGRHEDVGVGYDLSTDQLMLWVESGTFRPVQRHRQITLAELVDDHPDLADAVVGHLAALVRGEQ